jgi:hypothetical protein
MPKTSRRSSIPDDARARPDWHCGLPPVGIVGFVASFAPVRPSVRGQSASARDQMPEQREVQAGRATHEGWPTQLCAVRNEFVSPGCAFGSVRVHPDPPPRRPEANQADAAVVMMPCPVTHAHNSRSPSAKAHGRCLRPGSRPSWCCR